MSETQVRVRYAPSPTGHLHIGGARTALFNYLFAKRHNGKFIIRIEDTDLKRNVANAEFNQLDNLRWLGVEWDESVDKDGGYGPYRSMERLHLYKPFIDRLLEQGDAYRCYCTEEELEAEREEQKKRGETPKYSGKCCRLSPEQINTYMEEGRSFTIRFKVPLGKKLVVEDMIRGTVTFESDDVGDFVIIKKDGVPTYNFAVVIDDALMEITHVIRGEEHLSNTPKQLLIYSALGLKIPQFAHLPLILNQDRQKMSKRDESIIQFIEQYRELGYLPEAIINFLALLGWSPEGEEEIFSLAQLEQVFSIDRVSKSPAVFNTEKLAWLNSVYMKQAELARITDLCIPHLEQAGYIKTPLSDKELDWVTRLVGLYKEKIHYAQEIVAMASLFFKDEIQYDESCKEVLSEPHVPTILSLLKAKIETSEEFNPENIKNWLKEIQKETGHKGKALFMPVRAAITGQTHGPDLEQSIYLLGKEKVLKRMNHLLEDSIS